MADTKKCSTCKQVKSLNEFTNDRTKKDGKRSNCKTCKLQSDIAWRNRNPEKVDEIRSRWDWWNYHLKTNYDIVDVQYEQMLTEQDNKCLICLETMVKPQVDHCHTTGKVRGLLCMHCNTALGKFKDDVNILQRAIDYINQHI